MDSWFDAGNEQQPAAKTSEPDPKKSPVTSELSRHRSVETSSPSTDHQLDGYYSYHHARWQRVQRGALEVLRFQKVVFFPRFH